jgi:hypothetical protein
MQKTKAKLQVLQHETNEEKHLKEGRKTHTIEKNKLIFIQIERARDEIFLLHGGEKGRRTSVGKILRR